MIESRRVKCFSLFMLLRVPGSGGLRLSEGLFAEASRGDYVRVAIYEQDRWLGRIIVYTKYVYLGFLGSD